MIRKFLCGPAYRLGEAQRHHLTIKGFDSLLREKRIAYAPEALGIGWFHASTDIYRLATGCVESTLADAGIAPEEIDQVIVSSSQLLDSFEVRNRGIGRLLKSHRIQPTTIRGVSGAGCVDLLSAIDLACALLDRGGASNVLVLALECHSSQDDLRVLDYGIISDAAASLVVTKRPSLQERAAAMEILATSLQALVSEIGAGMPPSTAHLYGGVIRDIVARTHLGIGSVARVFANNAFLPIKNYRERNVGFGLSQLFLSNVPRIGHCPSCDPLINLMDCPLEQRGDLCMLYAYSDGHAGAVLLATGPARDGASATVSTE